MPTYEYQCDACNHNFDEFQSMSDKPLKKCPKCGKRKLRRLFGGGAAILFKGSGFYQTDYRSESYKTAAKSDESAAKPAESGSSGTNGTGGKASEGAAGTSTNGKGNASATGKSSKSAT
jgi:putative FmdB family regulatory protein